MWRVRKVVMSLLLMMLFWGSQTKAHYSPSQGYFLTKRGTEPVEPVQFMIIHKLSRYHISPCMDGKEQYLCVNPPNSEHKYSSTWIFESKIGEWGVIKSFSSNLVFYPSDLGNRSVLVLEEFKKEVGTLDYFAIDQVNGTILHRFGKIVQPEPHIDAVIPVPPANSLCILDDDTHKEYSEWIFVNPHNQTQEVLPYGHPTVIGEWQLIFSLINASATQTWEQMIHIGKSTTDSESNGFKFGWEISTKAQESFWLASISFGASASFSEYIKQSHSSTWRKETTTTRTIIVTKGQSVAVWQLVFTGFQLGHKARHQSTIFWDTESIDTKPSAV